MIANSFWAASEGKIFNSVQTQLTKLKLNQVLWKWII